MTHRPVDDLLVRYRAALAIVRDLPPEERLDLLALVVCPTPALAHAPARPNDGRRFGAEARARALALIAGGMSWRRAACEVGASKATVAAWVREAREAANRDVGLPDESAARRTG
jgi:hypothetical protein